MDREPIERPPAPWVGILRCRKCGNTVECKTADLLRFAQSRKWLHCCNEQMALFTPADIPTDPSTEPSPATP